MPDEKDSQPLVTLDFTSHFPHKFWVSDWHKDGSYPEGFRYKILSARDESGDAIEMVVVLEQPGGYKTELKRLEGDLQAFERTAKIFVEGLSGQHGLGFEEIDLTTVRTFEEFDRRVTEAGWHEWQP